MITFVLGPSGSGKTNWLIQQANEDKKAGNGNIAFIDSEDSHIFSLDHGVRLINAKDFAIKNQDMFYGFLSGIISRDYDLQKIYVDGIYDIVDITGELEALTAALVELSKKNNVELFLGLNLEKTAVPTHEDVKVVELAVEA